jgi:RNA polymerase sigma-70 factor (ECF subfamily)
MSTCLERARSGDRAAIIDLIESLRPRLERMAAYYARRCGEDPDDLLQEAWLGLLEALPVLDLRIGTPEQYLIKCARWRLLDAVKYARRRRCASLEEEPIEELAAPSEEAVISGAAVEEFLTQLKSTQRAVLECLLEGLTWREAGRVLGCSSANVAYHVRQIRRRYEDWSAGTRAQHLERV